MIETLEYIRVEKYVLALIGSAIWPFQLEKLHSLRKIYSTRFQVIQKIWQMTWWSRNSSSFNFQLHFHPRNCELEMKAPFFNFFLNFPTDVCQLFSFIIAHSKCLLFMEVFLLIIIIYLSWIKYEKVSKIRLPSNFLSFWLHCWVIEVTGYVFLTKITRKFGVICFSSRIWFTYVIENTD